MNRRDFIRQSGCAAMGSTTLFSTLANLSTLNGAMAAPGNAAAITDYKAIVCILFSGGMDSFNMLVPTGTTASGDNGFNEYKAVRTDLAFANASNLLALNNPQCSSFRGIPCSYSSFGIHPQMSGVQNLFNNNKLAFMGNIGTLVEPLANKTEYNNSLKKKPNGLYSHSDQQMQWQTSVPQSRDALGVGGRMADLLNAANANPNISMNVSLAGKNNFQRGQNMGEYSIRNDISANNVGVETLPTWWGNSGLLTTLRNTSVDNLVSQAYSNLLQKTYSTTTKSTTQTFEVFKEALKRVPTFTTQFADNELSNDLSAVAKVVSVRDYLGAKRQIFFIDYSGWDMHSDLVNGLNNQMQVVSQAMKSFYDATVELGIADKITTFSISDFGRTITSNGNGADHAWGGNSMVMGGAVKGGKIYGAYPKMDVVNYNRNVSFRGSYIPSISTDELYGELALWYGVSPYDLCYVLPNLSNFYSYSANNYPVGFMNFNGTTISTDDLPQNCLTY
jgi:uncharacterized protein (DUF1501 family)